MSIWSLDRYSPEGRRAIGLDVAAGAIALALLLLVTVDFSAPLRLVLALLFTFYVPGRAVVTNWPGLERWSGVGMSIVFSLGLLTLLATFSLWAGLWHPLTLFLAEAVASLAGLGFSLVRRYQADRDRAQAAAGPARTSWPAADHRPTAQHGHGEAAPRHRQEDGPTQVPSWTPADDRRPEFSPGLPAQDGHPEFSPRPAAPDRRPTFQAWPAAQEPQAEAPPPPPVESRRPEFRPRPEAREREAQTPPPAQDRRPTFQPWPRAEQPYGQIQPAPAEEEPPAEAPPWPRGEGWRTES